MKTAVVIGVLVVSGLAHSMDPSAGSVCFEWQGYQAEQKNA